jgi:hypothetical protein
VAGVFPYALYLYQRLWRPDLSALAAARLAALLICETSKLDPKVGPCPDVLILKQTGLVRFTEDEIRKILEQNENRISRLANSFKEENVQ